MFDKAIIHKRREPVNKKLMQSDDGGQRFSLGGFAIEREVVGTDRAVAVIGPVKGDAIFRLADFIAAQSMVRARTVPAASCPPTPSIVWPAGKLAGAAPRQCPSLARR